MEHNTTRRAEKKREFGSITKNTISQIIFVFHDLGQGSFFPNYYNPNRKKHAYQNLREAILNGSRLSIMFCIGHSPGLIHPGLALFPGTVFVFTAAYAANIDHPLKFQFNTLHDRAFYHRPPQQRSSKTMGAPSQQWRGQE